MADKLTHTLLPVAKKRPLLLPIRRRSAGARLGGESSFECRANGSAQSLLHQLDAGTHCDDPDLEGQQRAKVPRLLLLRDAQVLSRSADIAAVEKNEQIANIRSEPASDPYDRHDDAQGECRAEMPGFEESQTRPEEDQVRPREPEEKKLMSDR
ncbi:MAG: hypothetical protein IPK00_18695 [Deltaproteobacteria bacterium]|nr:hypothetical protein [Deltaproteobacteria bacterium]